MSGLWNPKAGTGNWSHFPTDRLDEVLVATERWKSAFEDIERPWLCWCVNDEWCKLQQKLVQAAGWTPVVGTDGSKVASPTVVDGSVLVDFNADLQMPCLYMHFPLEFVFAFCEKLAFWHSDVLPPVHVMKSIGQQFDSVQQGQIISVRHRPSVMERVARIRKGLRSREILYWLRHNGSLRWFEVIGCTTRDASQSQFDTGYGWWRHVQKHPNASRVNWQPFWDHGAGIHYWEQAHAGQCIDLEIDIEMYHFTTKGNARLKDQHGLSNKGQEMGNAYDLDAIEQGLGL